MVEKLDKKASVKQDLWPAEAPPPRLLGRGYTDDLCVIGPLVGPAAPGNPLADTCSGLQVVLGLSLVPLKLIMPGAPGRVFSE